MSNRRSTWIERRGQRGADAAIDQVIERQPYAGEQVQQLADEVIEDSPYQARQTFSIESVQELAQGMREAGFQGVLIVRPHSDPAKRRRGIVQLVYGHRRRIAWRQVCAERSAPCFVPVVVREVDDAVLLTIGAQENLQRQDLDPIEEAQIVAWHERMFFDKNQAQIGALLGKSSDWVSVRSRVHKLPDILKDRLRQRPRAIKQILELAVLYLHQPEIAVGLADRVVNEQLSVEALRAVIDRQANDQDIVASRDKKNNRRASATSVQDITTGPHLTQGVAPIAEEILTHYGANTHSTNAIANTQIEEKSLDGSGSVRLSKEFNLDGCSIANAKSTTTDLARLAEAANALMLLASHADKLPLDMFSEQMLNQIENALNELRRSFARRMSEAQMNIPDAD